MNNSISFWEKVRSRQNRAAVILVVGSVGVIVVWVSGFLVGRSSDLTLFLGRFHPSLVHFPVGILVLAAVLELWNRVRPDEFLNQAARLALLMGTWAAIVASFVGLHMESAGGYEASTIFLHKVIGFVLVVLGATAYLFKSGFFHGKDNSRVGLLLQAGILLSIVIGGHFGGDLTHHEGYLTRYAPDGLRSIIGLPAKSDIGKLAISDPSEAPVFSNLIEPILDNRCVNCHNPETNEGDLILSTPQGILEGGNDGEVIIPGRSSRSELVQRIWLPLNHDDHMPPAHRRQVTAAEATLIRWWIDEGASFEQTLGEISISPEIEAILEAYSLSEIRRGIFVVDVAEPDSVAVEELRLAGLDISPLAETENFVEIRCPRGSSCLTPEVIQLMNSIAENIAWLDLGESVVSDASLSFISELPHVTRLHLDQTTISDDALSHLNELEFLEYLNLYKTSITDEGLVHLEGLRSLRSIYLWQTNVTSEGIDRLSTSLPNLSVDAGESEE